MKTKRSFEYYKQLLTDLNQPFYQTPDDWDKTLIIFPRTSCYFETLPQTKVINTEMSSFLIFDYNAYEHDKYGEKDTIEEINKYVISRGGDI